MDYPHNDQWCGMCLDVMGDLRPPSMLVADTLHYLFRWFNYYMDVTYDYEYELSTTNESRSKYDSFARVIRIQSNCRFRNSEVDTFALTSSNTPSYWMGNYIMGWSRCFKWYGQSNSFPLAITIGLSRFSNYLKGILTLQTANLLRSWCDACEI